MQKGSEDTTQNRCHQHSIGGHSTCGLLLLIILVSWTSICEGAPFSSPVLGAEDELPLWNGIDDACSAVLPDPQLAVSSTLRELCFMVMRMQQKSQGEEKDDFKREEVQVPGGVISNGYFLFRPRNGRRSAGFR
uniref:Isoform 2 of Neuromedin-U n=1 Tax=Ranoidea caerulea TaxID=30344 RepID=P81872-2|nr:neuromedin U [Ranoidea caerulea]